MTVATGDEIQRLTVEASAGTFTLTFNEQTTAPVAFNVSSTALKVLLVALSNVATADVTVAGEGPYDIQFQGAYQDTNVPPLTVDDAELTGTAVVSTVAAGNPAVTESVYVDISTPGGTVAQLEMLPGQIPPPGHVRVSRADYYA